MSIHLLSPNVSEMVLCFQSVRPFSIIANRRNVISGKLKSVTQIYPCRCAQSQAVRSTFHSPVEVHTVRRSHLSWHAHTVDVNDVTVAPAASWRAEIVKANRKTRANKCLEYMATTAASGQCSSIQMSSRVFHIRPGRQSADERTCSNSVSYSQ